MSAQDNAVLARRIYQLFSEDKFDDVLELVSQDIEAVLVPFGQTFHGREGFMQFMQRFKGAFPDLRISVTNQVATDESVVSEFTAKGTHTGPLLTPAGAIPPTVVQQEHPHREALRKPPSQL
jgi:predicted ester cyclase